MPTINLPPRKKKTWHRKETDKRKLRAKAYASPAWRKARLEKLMKCPMCEICGKNVATQVHHLKSPFGDNKVDYALFLSEDNLLSICAQCHGNLHSGKIKGPENNQPDEDPELDITII